VSEHDRGAPQRIPGPTRAVEPKKYNRGTNVEVIIQFGDAGVAGKIILN
jgi:hypothetical protein